jgi:hypothetical protein
MRFQRQSPYSSTLANPNACKDQIYYVLGEVQKANRINESLKTGIKDDRESAARQIRHLKLLKKYQEKTGKVVLTAADIETLYEEYFEKPDVEMKEDKPDTGSSSANQSLTSQSLSFNGFSDSDSDYIP